MKRIKIKPVTTLQRNSNLFQQALNQKDPLTALSLYSPMFSLQLKFELIEQLLKNKTLPIHESCAVQKIIFEIAETGDVNKVPNHFFVSLMKSYTTLSNINMSQLLILTMVEHKIVPCLVTINYLLSLYAKHGMWRESTKFVQSAIERNIPLNDASWVLLISAHSAVPYKSLEILNMIEDSGIKPTAGVFESCLTVFSKNGDIKGMETVTAIMKTKNISFHRNIYHVLMNGYLEAGQVKKAVSLLKQVRPDTATYNIMLKVQSKMSDPAAAASLIDKMKKPDVITFNTLMFSFARKHDIENTKYYFEQIYAHGLVPSVVSWTTLMGVYGYSGNLVKAREIFEQMDLVVISTQKTFSNLIHMHYKLQEYEQVLSYHSKMLKRGLQYNTTVVECMLGTYLSSKDIEKMKALFDTAQSLCLVTTTICNSMFHTYKPEESVKSLYNLIKSYKLKPDQNTVDLMKLHAKHEDVEMIDCFVKELLSSKFTRS
jgi:pentatricopeptide repeat protein